MGGEKSFFFVAGRSCLGSPPHGRGKVGFFGMGRSNCGITPAWAGKSKDYAGWKSGMRDHPRMGGEKPHPAVHQAEGLGSPPHGRGKVIAMRNALSFLGITPAWAGKSPACAPERPENGDHPRMGGEKYSVGTQTARLIGSPPHGRGKVRPEAAPGHGGRITPAWAGKSSRLAYNYLESQDHPRMGGEKMSIGSVSISFLGSPPHGRGKA